MARILGGIGASHTPTIGFAYDHQKQQDPAWSPIFAGFEPVRQWLEQQRPDALLYVFNDHVTSFFFDHYSAFALGIDERYATADEGGGARELPPMPGHPELARHIGASLLSDEFDMAFFQGKPLDHGFFSPLSVLLGREGQRWPTRVVPLQVGVLQFPVPTAARCFKLGQALRRAIESYPQDLRVVIVATGGLSHQVHGERAGFNNPDWDRKFLDLVTTDPLALTAMTQAEYAELGGFEGAEVIMWLIMRGALSANVRRLHSSYYLPSMTGIATLLLENEAGEMSEPARREHLRHMERQLAGVEQLPGTYPFTHAASLKTYRINKFLRDLVIPAHRQRFLSDPEGLFEEAGLSAQERDLLRRRDWPGLIHYGAIFFGLEKLGAVLGVSNPHIYAAMRGQPIEEFLRTRNTSAQYSVAGREGTADAAATAATAATAAPRPDTRALRGITSMATARLLQALAGDYQQRSGQAVELVSIGGVDAARQVQAGAEFDLVVLAADAIERLLESGHVRPGSRVDLVRSSLAVAVRSGAHRPDVGSEQALRAAVLAAAGIGYSTGPSGTALLQLLQRWGISEQVRSRLVQASPGVPVGSLLTGGQVTLGFQQLSELQGMAGIEVLGNLPDDCAIETIFCGAICSVSSHPAAAAELLAYLASPQTAEAKRRHGMAPA